MSESNDPKAVEYLVQALGDPDMRVKAKAIDACGNLRATDATPVLIQQLFLRGTDAEVKQRILAALGKIGDGRAAKPIQEFLSRDLDHATRGTAILRARRHRRLRTRSSSCRPSSAPSRTRRSSASPAKRSRRSSTNRRCAKPKRKQPLNTFLPPEPPQQ